MKKREWFEKTEQIPFILAIRKGFIMIIPVLMIGSFSLVLNSFPVPAYQALIKEILFDGRISQIFVAAHNATFGMLSLYVTVFVSVSYARQFQAKVPFIYGAPVVSLICFGVLSGFDPGAASSAPLGVRGMFVAILSAVLASWMYTALASYRWGGLRLYTDGADIDVSQAFSSIAPAAAVVVFFVSINMALCRLFSVGSFYELFSLGANGIFANMGSSLLSITLYVFLSSLMWFFGIHGSDVLDGVAQSLFVPGTLENARLEALGLPPTEIFTKHFLDVFVVLGGCGATLCLLIAMLLFTRRRGHHSLSKLAAAPMLFNINEIMVFGLPIVYNPFMFVPFILTPIVLLLVSAAAMKLGLVPIPHFDVSWTTPVILSGWISTGSFAGAALQVVNLAIGAAIYAPFLRMYDREQTRAAARQAKTLVEMLRQSEESQTPVTLTEYTGAAGAVAKMLALDLKHALSQGQGGIKLHYQPQYDSSGRCVGAEALLRWNHPSCGMIYPPLVIKLAQESGILRELETRILLDSALALREIRRLAPSGFKLSVNITPGTFQSPDFAEFLSTLPERTGIDAAELWIEVTEQVAFDAGGEGEEAFSRIRAMGYHMAIDDFSMGHTSLKYLQSSQFDLVKIDGALVREINLNPRCRDIIASVVHLAKSLGFHVCAEYVETEEQRAALEQIGCHIYQGWLYSPAVPLDELLETHCEAMAALERAVI